MSIEVQTVTTCERCGLTDTRVGDYTDMPPVGWYRLRIDRYYAGTDGYPHSASAVVGVLCPDCAGVVIQSTESTA